MSTRPLLKRSLKKSDKSSKSEQTRKPQQNTKEFKPAKRPERRNVSNKKNLVNKRDDSEKQDDVSDISIKIPVSKTPRYKSVLLNWRLTLSDDEEETDEPSDERNSHEQPEAHTRLSEQGNTNAGSCDSTNPPTDDMSIHSEGNDSNIGVPDQEHERLSGHKLSEFDKPPTSSNDQRGDANDQRIEPPLDVEGETDDDKTSGEFDVPNSGNKTNDTAHNTEPQAQLITKVESISNDASDSSNDEDEITEISRRSSHNEVEIKEASRSKSPILLDADESGDNNVEDNEEDNRQTERLEIGGNTSPATPSSSLSAGKDIPQNKGNNDDANMKGNTHDPSTPTLLASDSSAASRHTLNDSSDDATTPEQHELSKPSQDVYSKQPAQDVANNPNSTPPQAHSRKKTRQAQQDQPRNNVEFSKSKTEQRSSNVEGDGHKARKTQAETHAKAKAVKPTQTQPDKPSKPQPEKPPKPQDENPSKPQTDRPHKTQTNKAKTQTEKPPKPLVEKPPKPHTDKPPKTQTETQKPRKTIPEKSTKPPQPEISSKTQTEKSTKTNREQSTNAQPESSRRTKSEKQTKPQLENPTSKRQKSDKPIPEAATRSRRTNTKGAVVVNDMEELLNPKSDKHQLRHKERVPPQPKRSAPRSSKKQAKAITSPPREYNGRPDIPDTELRSSDDDDSDSDEDIFQKAMRKYGINVDDSD